ncbi:hypothetical protein NC653_026902 [Populus alba x Populus x berolinensis]|uniref:Uncharacterized protein n=1 Tax=Populus alba x Populus x berolinensis TaxID=444605 RepID=A0AAD6M4C5_9ROSI|nr:hypothetical protein NC653_026902 [Populus alba x Populus x berolinensis]
MRSFGSFSRLGRCGDSSSLTSQSFRASHDLYGIFPGIVYFLLNLLALSREHIQLKQSVRLVVLEESHIDKSALAKQGMERCIGPRFSYLACGESVTKQRTVRIFMGGDSTDR